MKYHCGYNVIGAEIEKHQLQCMKYCLQEQLTYFIRLGNGWKSRQRHINTFTGIHFLKSSHFLSDMVQLFYLILRHHYKSCLTEILRLPYKCCSRQHYNRILLAREKSLIFGIINQFQPRDVESESNPVLKKEVLDCRHLTDWTGEESPIVHFGNKIGTCVFTRKRDVPSLYVNSQVNVEQKPTVLCSGSSTTCPVSDTV